MWGAPSPAFAKVYHSRSEALELAFPDAERVDSKTFLLDDAQAARVEELSGASLESRLVKLYTGVRGEDVLGYAFIDVLAPVLALISPLKVVELFGVDLSDEILAAAFISLFTGFSISVSSISVQTYVNRRVPRLQQGRVFGLQSVFANAAVLIPMLLLGLIASLTSIQAILFFTPAVVLLAILGLLALLARISGKERPRGREVISSFWEEPEAARNAEAERE